MTDKDKSEEHPHIIIHAPAEILTCSICGKEYVSRGKYDPGFCRQCADEMKNKKLMDGILEGW